jgi:hypothetical protein
MEKGNIVKLHARFDSAVQIWPESDLAVEFWFALELTKVFDYVQWRHYEEVRP